MSSAGSHVLAESFCDMLSASAQRSREPMRTNHANFRRVHVQYAFEASTFGVACISNLETAVSLSSRSRSKWVRENFGGSSATKVLIVYRSRISSSG
ncbi:uncharacterized protein MYCFIDRAFT_175884 [Pseudocercospora fijiensis CIRAD86]|uniref:Uncharacterized protein n=1 Tax=Pseudocercospora fijiensis (strain CIRAD86) TaxID=383855 RepID=M2YXB2_PSEFD|nr:uncharacterized protein MYCFIDRAFT_175884 [Pseudocercospora fijiensis CIRAD86]EME82345.1 hypothetical protein MYCFIDRAFT_175884 [Pseudocercospora fijiensis CIRAD86]